MFSILYWNIPTYSSIFVGVIVLLCIYLRQHEPSTRPDCIDFSEYLKNSVLPSSAVWIVEHDLDSKIYPWSYKHHCEHIYVKYFYNI